MLVATSREAAVTYKKELEKLNAPRSKIIMTSYLGEKGKDGMSWDEYFLTHDQREEEAARFKSPDDPTKKIRLEYDRIKDELNYWKAEINSWKAELNNITRTYQQFVDRNVELKKREDELQQTIDELENKKAELQKTKFNEPLSEFHDNTVEYNLYSEVKQEEVIFTNDVFVPPSNMTINWENENETLHHPPQDGSPSEALIFDTKDLFTTKAQHEKL